MRKQQAGFTLIEIVMVIVILGILAAFALPRFADLTGEAREASVRGLAGALKSAASIARAQQLATNTPLSQPVTLDGISVAMSAGYPTATQGTGNTPSGIEDAAGVSDQDYTIAHTAAGGGNPALVTFSVAGGSGTCEAVYTEATESGGSISTSFIVTVDVSGC